MRRVVVTGIGLVSPLAGDTANSWARLIDGQSGIRNVTSFDVSDLPVTIGAEVPRGEGEGEFHADSWLAPKDQRKNDDFILYAIGAASQAIEDSGWMPDDDEGRERTGVMIGSGIGGLPGIYDASVTMHERGARRVVLAV